MKLEHPRNIFFFKFSIIKYLTSPFSGIRVVPRGWTDTRNILYRVKITQVHTQLRHLEASATAYRHSCISN